MAVDLPIPRAGMHDYSLSLSVAVGEPLHVTLTNHGALILDEHWVTAPQALVEALRELITGRDTSTYPEAWLLAAVTALRDHHAVTVVSRWQAALMDPHRYGGVDPVYTLDELRSAFTPRRRRP